MSAVAFDVGETLADETAAWEAVAVAAHVSCLALFGVLGGLDVDFVGSSSAWHVEKPAPEFFERVAAETGLTPAEIAYVGDRVDDDAVPAADARIVAVHLRRGRWGNLNARWPEVERAAIRLDSLAGLPEALAHV